MQVFARCDCILPDSWYISTRISGGQRDLSVILWLVTSPRHLPHTIEEVRKAMPISVRVISSVSLFVLLAVNANAAIIVTDTHIRYHNNGSPTFTDIVDPVAGEYLVGLPVMTEVVGTSTIRRTEELDASLSWSPTSVQASTNASLIIELLAGPFPQGVTSRGCNIEVRFNFDVTESEEYLFSYDQIARGRSSDGQYSAFTGATLFTGVDELIAGYGGPSPDSEQTYVLLPGSYRLSVYASAFFISPAGSGRMPFGTSEFANSLTISVVPSPAALGVLLTSGVAYLRHRRRA